MAKKADLVDRPVVSDGAVSHRRDRVLRAALCVEVPEVVRELDEPATVDHPAQVPKGVQYAPGICFGKIGARLEAQRVGPTERDTDAHRMMVEKVARVEIRGETGLVDDVQEAGNGRVGCEIELDAEQE